MDTRHFATKYGGLRASVVTRSEELHRLMGTRATNGSNKGSRMALACLYVAALEENDVLETKKLAKMGGCKPDDIRSTARTVMKKHSRILRNASISSSALCIRFGCESITDLVQRVTAHFAVQITTSESFSTENTVFAAACLYACANATNIKVDKDLLQDIACATRAYFEPLVDSIQKNCAKVLSGTIKRTKKRPASASSVESTPMKEIKSTNVSDRSIQLIEKLRTMPLDVPVPPVVQDAPTYEEKQAPVAPQETYKQWRQKALKYMQEHEND